LVKYGYSNFRLEILEYCESEDVVAREQYYLDLLKPEYNILSTAGSSLGYKHTTEYLAKMSGQNHIMFGKKHSESSKEKIRQALLGENNPNACKVSVLDLETNTETVYGSFRGAARALNSPAATFRGYLKSGSKPYKERYVIKSPPQYSYSIQLNMNSAERARLDLLNTPCSAQMKFSRREKEQTA
jgi:group I intron endonuclease